MPFAFFKEGNRTGDSFEMNLLLQGGHKQDSSRKVHRSSSLQRMASAEHTPKKACHGRMNRQDSVLKAEVEAAGA